MIENYHSKNSQKTDFTMGVRCFIGELAFSLVANQHYMVVQEHGMNAPVLRLRECFIAGFPNARKKFHSDWNMKLPHFSSYYRCACKNGDLSGKDSRILAVLIESTQCAPAQSTCGRTCQRS